MKSIGPVMISKSSVFGVGCLPLNAANLLHVAPVFALAGLRQHYPVRF